MTPTQITDIIQRAEHINQVAVRTHNSRYYAHLCRQDPQADSEEKCVAQYAQLLKFGPVASTPELHALATRLTMPLPQELQTFFQCVGGLCLLPLHIHSARSLLAYLDDASDCVGTPASSIPKSLGLVDMIKLNWGNDRFELEPDNRIVQQSDIDTLNARYTSIGWYSAAGDDGCESATHIFFDREGNFGTLYYHQDEFEEFWEGDLKPMLTASPERKNLFDIVMDALNGTFVSNDDDDDDDGDDDNRG